MRRKNRDQVMLHWMKTMKKIKVAVMKKVKKKRYILIRNKLMHCSGSIDLFYMCKEGFKRWWLKDL